MPSSTQVIYHRVDKGEAGKKEGKQMVSTGRANEQTGQQTKRQVVSEEGHGNEAEGKRTPVAQKWEEGLCRGKY